MCTYSKGLVDAVKKDDSFQTPFRKPKKEKTGPEKLGPWINQPSRQRNTEFGHLGLTWSLTHPVEDKRIVSAYICYHLTSMIPMY